MYVAQDGIMNTRLNSQFSFFLLFHSACGYVQDRGSLGIKVRWGATMAQDSTERQGTTKRMRLELRLVALCIGFVLWLVAPCQADERCGAEIKLYFFQPRSILS